MNGFTRHLHRPCPQRVRSEPDFFILDLGFPLQDVFPRLGKRWDEETIQQAQDAILRISSRGNPLDVERTELAQAEPRLEPIFRDELRQARGAQAGAIVCQNRCSCFDEATRPVLSHAVSSQSNPSPKTPTAG